MNLIHDVGERTMETVNAFVALWCATAEPGKGHAEEAAEWRARLPEAEATEPRDKKND